MVLLLLAFVPVIARGRRYAVGGDAAKRRRWHSVILHFAYGSNMSRAVMCKHAPEAEPIGVATLKTIAS